MLGAAEGGGVPEGRGLIEFAEAALADHEPHLARVRSRLAAALGHAGLVDAAGIIGFFNAIDRVADATGIPLDPERVPAPADLRARLGIDTFLGERG